MITHPTTFWLAMLVTMFAATMLFQAVVIGSAAEAVAYGLAGAFLALLGHSFFKHSISMKQQQ
ncbi:MAG: hypothetical protein WDZ31_01450 [Phycisphaeraceae bacterium]